ncbi:hypothetical protein MPSEU_000728800 [Mayamaea pseudoterrestris]|nr:hypothetical protein MPSEU_000728800 [Mayamaea pseudoterrestris]
MTQQKPPTARTLPCRPKVEYYGSDLFLPSLHEQLDMIDHARACFHTYQDRGDCLKQRVKWQHCKMVQYQAEGLRCKSSICGEQTRRMSASPENGGNLRPPFA